METTYILYSLAHKEMQDVHITILVNTDYTTIRLNSGTLKQQQ